MVIKYTPCEVVVMDRCPFCSIVRGELPAKVEYEDEHCIVFRDAAPQAPVHLLAVPKAHVASADDVSDPTLWSDLMVGVTSAVKALGLTGGYRLVVNCGETAGQTVPHLHIHILAGRGLHWPPG